MRDLTPHLAFLLRLSQDWDLICVTLVDIHFQSHWGFWQNSFPCVCRIKCLFPCWLLTGGYSQSLEVSFTSWFMAFFLFRASSGSSSPSPASYLFDLLFCLSFPALTWKKFFAYVIRLHPPGSSPYFRICNLNYIYRISLPCSGTYSWVSWMRA